MESQPIVFYADPEHDCPYESSRRARNAFVGPETPLTPFIYSQLIRLGFRRSGDHVYRPYCVGCQKCMSYRIHVDEFEPNRSLRRVMSRNKDCYLNIVTNEFRQEHFDLYMRYQQHRHEEGEMNDDDPERYRAFLQSGWCKTQLLEIRERGSDQLLVVSVTDFVEDGLSAFYTFFEPEPANRAFGNLAILMQIDLAKLHGLPYLYLGYWIHDSPKMQYKSRFQPAEVFDGEQWVEINQQLAIVNAESKK